MYRGTCENDAGSLLPGPLPVTKALRGIGLEGEVRLRLRERMLCFKVGTSRCFVFKQVTNNNKNLCVGVYRGIASK